MTESAFYKAERQSLWQRGEQMRIAFSIAAIALSFWALYFVFARNMESLEVQRAYFNQGRASVCDDLAASDTNIFQEMRNRRRC